MHVVRPLLACGLSLLVFQSGQIARAQDLQTIAVKDLPQFPDQPNWANPVVHAQGPFVWVVALLPVTDKIWNARLLDGSKQAQTRLFAVAQDALARHEGDWPPSKRARSLSAVKERLELMVDPQSFVQVETVERPDGVWMRFAYPAAEIDQALGFALPGTSFPGPRAAQAGSQASSESTESTESTASAAVRSPGHATGDYAWELAWLAGVALVTFLVSGVALAVGH